MTRRRGSLFVLPLLAAMVGISSIASAAMVDNIAPDATASASSFYTADYAPAKINDGSTAYGGGTAWSSAAVASPHWIMLTWAQNVQFDEVKVFGPGVSSAALVPYNPYDFLIQTSNDGASWTNIDTVTANTDSIYTFTSVSPISAKHLRVYVTTPTNGKDDYSRLTEVEVNGVPEPATMGLVLFGGAASVLRRRRRS